MIKKTFLVSIFSITLILIFSYVSYIATAHEGGGTTAHGDTIDLKIKEVWVGSSSSDLNKVFSGPSDGPVTVTASSDQWMSLTIEVQLTTIDSFLDNINPWSDNWPDIEEEVFWGDFYNQRYYKDPPDTISVRLGMKVSDILKLDGVPDNQFLIGVVGWFGAASIQDTHTVRDDSTLIVQAPGEYLPPSPDAPTLDMTASPMTIIRGQSTNISWISTNTTSCTGSRGGSYPISGSFTSSPSVTTTYGLTCTGPNGSVSDSVTVTVTDVPNRSAVGNHDGADNNSCRTTGWAYDPDDSGRSIDVHIYIDGEAGKGGQIIDKFTTNVYRSDVNASYGISGNHGFDANLSPYIEIADNKTHSLYVYAIDSSGSGSNPLLNNSPKTIKCAAPAPAPGETPPSIDIKAQ